MGTFGIDIGNASVIPTDVLEIHFGQQRGGGGGVQGPSSPVPLGSANGLSRDLRCCLHF